MDKIQDIFDKLDLGLQLHHEQMVRDAIQAGEKLLPKLSSRQVIAQLNSKLGNAYSDLFRLFEHSNGVKSIPLSENLQKAKTFYRDALTNIKDQNPHLEKQI